MITIRILPGREPELHEVENELSALQAAVGGYIETVTLPDSGLVVIVNEEGRYLGLPLNGMLNLRPLWHSVLIGTVLIARVSGEEFASVRPSDLDYIRRFWRPIV